MLVCTAFDRILFVVLPASQSSPNSAVRPGFRHGTVLDPIVASGRRPSVG